MAFEYIELFVIYFSKKQNYFNFTLHVAID